MPKIDLEKLTKAEKKQIKLNVWEKQRPVIEIGNSFYKVEPQPARAVLEFQELIQLYMDYAGQYKDIKVEEVGVKELRGLVETVVKSPYHLLKPFVPDLEQEDAEAAPWGQVWHNLSVLAEINGLGLGEKLLKEYILPFVPDLLKSVLTLGAGAAKARVSLGEIGSENLTSSSTTSEESPTESISEES